MLCINVQYLEVFLDHKQQKQHVQLDQQLLVEFRLIPFKHVQNNQNALLVNFKQLFLAFGLIELSGLPDSDIAESIGHVTKIFEKGGLA